MTAGNDYSDYLDITEEKKGGILKKIIREGTGDAVQHSGMTVKIKYEAKAENGDIIKNDPSILENGTYLIGSKSLGMGFDLLLRSMKKNEKALAVISPEYNTENGDLGEDSPTSSIHYEVELFDFHPQELTKDGCVSKYIITEGICYSGANDWSTIRIYFTCYTEEGKKVEERYHEFMVGEEKYEGWHTKGLERVIKKMKLNEKCRAFIKREYLFKQIPEGFEEKIPQDYKSLTFDIFLVTMKRGKEIWEMSFDEKLERAIFLKEKATDYFKQNEFSQSANLFKKVINYLGPDNDQHFKELEDQRKKTLLAAYLNAALTNLKLNETFKAIENCDSALLLDKDNVKAYFRRGSAKYENKDFESSLQDMDKVLTLDPLNKAASNLKKKCVFEMAKHRELEKQRYKGMFSAFAKQDEKLEKSQKNENDVWKNLNSDDFEGLQDKLNDQPIDMVKSN